jgi:hypothetical protein
MVADPLAFSGALFYWIQGVRFVGWLGEFFGGGLAAWRLGG